MDRGMKWRAWYSHGRIFVSDYILWDFLPRHGCLGVVVFSDTCNVIHCGDWYWRVGDRIESIPGSLQGVHTPPPPHVPWSSVKQGANVTDGEWARVIAEIEAVANGR